MYNSTNDCFISSPSSSSSSSNFLFNRQHYNSRYHPYHRISTSYYPNNESENYSYENNNHSTIENYNQSITSYDYNTNWTTSSSVIDNEVNIEEQTKTQSNHGTTGRFKFLNLFFFPLLLSSTENFFIH